MVYYYNVNTTKCKCIAADFFYKLNNGNLITIIMKNDFGKTIIVNYCDDKDLWFLIGEDGVRWLTTDKLNTVIEMMHVTGTISEVQFVERWEE